MIENVIIKLTILLHFKMDLALITDCDSDQTITSRQYVEAAGGGAGASDDRKWMIVGGIALEFDVGTCLSAVGKLVESGTYVNLVQVTT